jgi:hypothetical protein
MLLKFAKSKSAINYLLPTLAGLLFWMKELSYPLIYPYYTGEPDNLLFQPVLKLLQPYETLQTIVTLAIVVSLAYMIQQINNHYNFIRHRSYFPAIVFIIIISGFTEMQGLHPVYFASIFFIIAIYRLFDAFEKKKPYSAAFDSGFSLGIAALFYLNVILLFPAFIFGLSILSYEKRWREFVLMITGMILPFLLALSYTVITEQFLETFKIFERNLLTDNSHFNKNFNLQLYLGYLVFLTILGSLKILKQYDSEKVSTRKFFTIFFLLFVNSIGILLLVPSASQEMFIISAIPVTFLMSNFFLFIKSRLQGEFLFILLVAVIITLQFIK